MFRGYYTSFPKTLDMLSQRHIKEYKQYCLTTDYWKKASNPFDSEYSFQVLDEDVRVESIQDVLPQRAVNVLVRLAEVGAIKEHCCYRNSLLVAVVLHNECGIDIHCIDGFCKYETHSCLHRFCEYGGRYFDATLEVLLGYEGVIDYQYYAVRSFNSQELLALMFAYGKAVDYSVSPSFWSSLSSADERAGGTYDNESFYLDDNGRIAFI